MIRRLLGRPTGAAPALQPAPLSQGEVHAAISEASLHLDQVGHTLAEAHAALDAYWDSLNPADRAAAHERVSDAIRALGRTQAALARTRNGGAQ